MKGKCIYGGERSLSSSVSIPPSFEQRVTGVISLSEFELSKLKVYKVERSIYPSIFRIKQRVQPLCLDLFILREIDWKGRVQV